MNHTYQIRRYAALTAAVILSACMLAGCAKSDSSARDNAAGSGNGTNASGNVVAGAGGTSNNAGSIQETAAPQAQPETTAQTTAQTNAPAPTQPQTPQAQTAQTVTGTPQTTAQTNAPAAQQTQTTQNKPAETDEEEIAIELEGGDQGKDDAEDGEESFTGLFEKPDGTESVNVVLENDTTISFRFKKSRINGTAKVSGDTAVYHGDDDYTITFTVADDELGVVVGGEDGDRSAMNGKYFRVIEGDDDETEETEFDPFDEDDEDLDDDDYFAVFDELETEN